MEELLQQYEVAWQAGDRARARDRARALVKAYPDAFKPFAGLSLDVCVGMVSSYRAAGRTLERIAASVWVQAEFGPQAITGIATVGG